MASDKQDLEMRVGMVEYAVGEIKDGVKSIAASMDKFAASLHTLTVLEVKHEETREALGRAFSELKDHDTRLETIETAMPGLKEARGWAVRGLLAIVSVVGMAILALVIVSGKVEIKVGEAAASTQAAKQRNSDER